MREPRRSIRNMSYNRRHHGVTSKELRLRKSLEESIEIIAFIIGEEENLMESEDDSDSDSEEDLEEDVLVPLLIDYDGLLLYEAPIRQHRRYNPILIESLTEGFCWNQLRFRKHDLYQVFLRLQIPEQITLSNHIKIHGEEAVIVLLYRLSHPGKLDSLVTLFKRHNTTWSRLFNYMVRFLYQRFSHLLHDNLEYFHEYFADYNAAVYSRVRQNGNQFTARTRNTIGFVDAKNAEFVDQWGKCKHNFITSTKMVIVSKYRQW